MPRSCSRRQRPLEIPYDPGVVATSIGRGVPFALAQPQSPVAMAVAALADILAPSVAGNRPPEPGSAGARARQRAGAGHLLTR